MDLRGQTMSHSHSFNSYQKGLPARHISEGSYPHAKLRFAHLCLAVFCVDPSQSYRLVLGHESFGCGNIGEYATQPNLTYDGRLGPLWNFWVPFSAWQAWLYIVPWLLHLWLTLWFLEGSRLPPGQRSAVWSIDLNWTQIAWTDEMEPATFCLGWHVALKTYPEEFFEAAVAALESQHYFFPVAWTIVCHFEFLCHYASYITFRSAPVLLCSSTGVALAIAPWPRSSILLPFRRQLRPKLPQ